MVKSIQNSLSEYSVSETYPQIVNMNEFLLQINGYTSCFTVLNNFYKVDIPQLETPIILRTPVPILEAITSPAGKPHEPIFTHHNIILGIETHHLKNISLPAKPESFICPFSNFLVGYLHHRSTCLLIRASEYFRRAKPTTCRIHVGLYPPQYTMKTRLDEIYPSILLASYSRFTSHLFTPPAIPTISVLIFYWRKDEKLMSSSTANNLDVFLVADIQNIQDVRGTGPRAIIKAMQILKHCPSLR